VNALWRQLLFCCSWSRCLVFKYVQNRWGKRCSSYVDLIYHVWWLKHMFLYIVIWTLPFLTWFNSSFWFLFLYFVLVWWSQKVWCIEVRLPCCALSWLDKIELSVRIGVFGGWYMD
jgi:hypothetical protein